MPGLVIWKSKVTPQHTDFRGLTGSLKVVPDAPTWWWRQLPQAQIVAQEAFPKASESSLLMAWNADLTFACLPAQAEHGEPPGEGKLTEWRTQYHPGGVETQLGEVEEVH